MSYMLENPGGRLYTCIKALEEVGIWKFRDLFKRGSVLKGFFLKGKSRYCLMYVYCYHIFPIFLYIVITQIMILKLLYYFALRKYLRFYVYNQNLCRQ